ncbi:MAG TPA: hypothetical protein VMS71_00635, partial [Candidatus Acidoferrum sp.]|nr:hypothetical protein [Candidatus Acidoferrum sp.]
KSADSLHPGFFEARWKLICPNDLIDVSFNGDDCIGQGPEGRFVNRTQDFENFHRGGHGGGN